MPVMNVTTVVFLVFLMLLIILCGVKYFAPEWLEPGGNPLSKRREAKRQRAEKAARQSRRDRYGDKYR